MNTPGWQTEDLVEEWVSDNSNPSSPDDAVRSWTGSVHNPISQSPPTRHPSGDLSAVLEEDDDDDEVLSSPQGGTFVVRADQPLPETPLGLKPGQRPKKGAVKTFFSPLALERMFEPPSPPRSADMADARPRSTTPPLPPSPPVLTRPSHPSTHPIPPTRSKLSQSHVPPSPELEPDSLLDESTLDEDGPIDGDEILASDIPGLVGFAGRKPSASFKFTFEIPRTPTHPTDSIRSQRRSPPHPTPNPRALQNPETSWVHGQDNLSSDQVLPATDPRLKLFQFKYDTFTRDHLGALADSIAVKNSPSGTGDEEDGDEEPVWRSTKRIKLTPSEDMSSRTSSSRDFRNSPWGKVQSREYAKGSRSFARIVGGSRLPSMLSESQSLALFASADTVPRRNLDVPNDEGQRRATSTSSSDTAMTVATVAPIDHAPDVVVKRQSVNYRLQGANILAQIKNDVLKKAPDVSWDATTEEKSRQSTLDDRSYISTAMNRSRQSSDAEDLEKSSVRPKKKSPRKLLRRLSAADEVDRDIVAEISGNSLDFPGDKSLRELRAKHLPHLSSSQIVVPPTIVFTSRISERFASSSPAVTIAPPTPASLAPKQLPAAGRRIPSTAPLTLHPNHVPASHDDMNRFVSSSTASGISGTTAGSFVKHPGPGQLITIGPERIKDVVFPQAGGMVYSAEKHKWVRQAEEAEGDVSEDPFGDIESLQGTPRSDRQKMQEEDDEDISHDEEEIGSSEVQPATADQTMHVQDLTDEDEEHQNAAPNGELAVIRYDSDFTTTEDLTNKAPPASATDVARTPKSHARSLEELAEGIANISLQMDLSPVRPARPSTTARTPVPASSAPKATPKSVLKHTPAPITPRPTRPGHRNASHRRSVSFSDGRKTGKIRDTSGAVAAETEESDRSEEVTAPSVPATSFLASSRTKRIHALLDGLDDSGGFNTFVTQSERSKAPARTQQQLVESPIADTYAADPTPASSRSFARTRKKLPGDATFMTEASFRVTHDQLVRVLTSVEPYTPHWEQLKSIDVSKKGLESLNRLEELMPALDRLSVDDNQLTWFTGAPSNLRILFAANNSLTSLTSYAHLPNIEELDISHNQVDSLQQLECLHRLRDLKADGNQITNLDSLARLTSLVKISVKANQIGEIDLAGFSWPRLETLDLSYNRLESVASLGALPALVTVNLDHNQLRTMSSDVPLAKLRVLRLSYNALTRIDLAGFPNLRTVYADNNRLGDVVGIDGLARLENLSLRSQSSKQLSLCARDIRDVKRLYLSGNPLNELDLFSEACYNLIYLEMAACRFTTLPPNLAQMTPNLRVLNLNYNFLSDVAKSLTGLTRLRKLTVVGSRINASKPLLKMVQKLPELELVDFRMNPFSLGWYLPVMVNDLPGALQPSERGVSVVASPGGGQKRSRAGAEAGAPHNPHLSWTELDDRFRRDLPDAVYVARMGFRGLVMRACSKVASLDGVMVTDAEREKAHKLLKGLERSVNGPPKAPAASKVK